MGEPVSEDRIPDVLADRYASAEMAAIWSARGRVVLEREFWIAVMRGQRRLGVAIPEEALAAYERVKEHVDLASIRARERRTRHDVKARIEEYSALAGYEHVHKGLTSRDLTENVEQLQILRSLQLVQTKYAAAIHRLAGRVEEWRGVFLTARTHNVPAQLTTVGRRLAMFGTEMLSAYGQFESLLESYPLRGLKGAVGTQLDLLTLFGGDAEKVAALEQEIATLLGFGRVLGAVGQVYPRSLDFAVLSALYGLGSGPGSLAKTLRLMAGQELASEGFQADQVGSSAMPHKMNARSCERINGLHVILRGYVNMVMGLAGDQWNEGDVSCSVVRRVALPGAMFAIDGLLETLLTVLREMQIFPYLLAAEQDRVAPFLATTSVLMEAVQRGAGRESAHAAIRAHALAVAARVQDGRGSARELIDRLAGDARIGLSRVEVEHLVDSSPERLVGAALRQADDFVRAAGKLAERVRGARSYEPAPIL
jgi:adenylosuccinate lyase